MNLTAADVPIWKHQSNFWNFGLFWENKSRYKEKIHYFSKLVLNSGYKKTSITALHLHLEPIIYKCKLLDPKCFTGLILDAFLKPFEKYAVL
ncbi:MAG: hypothetical protein DRJ05_00155 [Bacteroidetes bacterium]|nr:MAG: hypothetical protein DRJ05_00155 [Bacteroidota bacterium]